MTALQNGEQAEIAKLRAELAQLKSNRNKLTFKVSVKGALSVYGMGRFPVTLYREQWEQVLAASDQIKAFIRANAGELSTK